MGTLALHAILDIWEAHCAACVRCREWTAQDWRDKHNPALAPCIEGEKIISRVAFELDLTA